MSTKDGMSLANAPLPDPLKSIILSSPTLEEIIIPTSAITSRLIPAFALYHVISRHLEHASTITNDFRTTAHGFKPNQGAVSPWYFFIPKSGGPATGEPLTDNPDYDGPLKISELSEALGTRASGNTDTDLGRQRMISRASERPAYRQDPSIDMEVCTLQISASGAGTLFIEPIGGDRRINRQGAAPTFPHRDWMIGKVRTRCSKKSSQRSRSQSRKRPASPTHLGTQPESVSKRPTPERSLARRSEESVGSKARPRLDVQGLSSSATAAWKPTLPMRFEIETTSTKKLDADPSAPIQREWVHSHKITTPSGQDVEADGYPQLRRTLGEFSSHHLPSLIFLHKGPTEKSMSDRLTKYCRDQQISIKDTVTAKWSVEAGKVKWTVYGL